MMDWSNPFPGHPGPPYKNESDYLEGEWVRDGRRWPALGSRERATINDGFTAGFADESRIAPSDTKARDLADWRAAWAIGNSLRFLLRCDKCGGTMLNPTGRWWFKRGAGAYGEWKHKCKATPGIPEDRPAQAAPGPGTWGAWAAEQAQREFWDAYAAGINWRYPLGAPEWRAPMGASDPMHFQMPREETYSGARIRQRHQTMLDEQLRQAFVQGAIGEQSDVLTVQHIRNLQRMLRGMIGEKGPGKPGR